MFCVVWDFSKLKLKEKQYKPNTAHKSYNADIKILDIPRLA